MTQESTHAAKVMDVTEGKIRCDAAAKQVLSNKDILAIILRPTLVSIFSELHLPLENL